MPQLAMDTPRPPLPFRNRRRFPRLEVMGQVDGELVALDVPLKVRDLSEAGFSTESTVPFPPGTGQRFRFTTRAGAVVHLEATSVHCRLASASADGHYVYVTGFEFRSNPDTDDAVRALVDTLSSVLSLE